MRVCLICSEFLGWGPAGGLGFAIRQVGRELVNRGVDVSAVIPCPRGENECTFQLDGISVFGYRRSNLGRFIRILKERDADIYHSEQATLATFLAQRAKPDRRHVIVLSDPRTVRDWVIEFRRPTLSVPRMLPAFVAYENPLTYLAVRRADLLFVPATFLISKSRKKYRLRSSPHLLPTPIAIPEVALKAAVPTVCYVGRLDRRKRPELFIELAKRFPGVQFIAVGGGQDPRFLAELERRRAGVRNLLVTGFIDQFADDRLSRVLAQSWVLVNTSAREGLPCTFLEAAAHRCAILSGVDPDGFASRFGYWARDGDLTTGLRALLEGDRWRALGQQAYQEVAAINNPPSAVNRLLDAYAGLTSQSSC